MRIDTVCNSLCGNPIFCLTITNDIHDYLTSEQEIHQFRRFCYEGNGELKTVVREKKIKKKQLKKEKLQQQQQQLIASGIIYSGVTNSSTAANSAA